jgi:hypothetical protein
VEFERDPANPKSNLRKRQVPLLLACQTFIEAALNVRMLAAIATGSGESWGASNRRFSGDLCKARAADTLELRTEGDSNWTARIVDL